MKSNGLYRHSIHLLLQPMQIKIADNTAEAKSFSTAETKKERKYS